MRNKTFKSISLLIAVIAVSLFSSCDNEQSGSGSKLDNVVTNVATDVTPFSVTLNGAINNYSVGEISRGQYGFLYTTEPSMDVAAAEQLFKQYVSEGSATGCKVRYATNLLDGNSFNVTVSGFQPETTIYYCGIFITKDNKTYIGGVQNMTTLSYTPQISVADVTSGVMYANLFANVDLGGAVSKDCEIALLYSASEDNLSNGSKVVCKRTETDGIYNAELEYLTSNTTYFYKFYLYNKTIKTYFYTDVLSFTTKNADDFAVDLGLSVKWASCDFGAEDPSEEGLWYSWGSLTSKMNGDISVYEHYKDNSYVNIGASISGTEYDAVTKYWGGKWRMPTKEEAEELINACNYKVIAGNPDYAVYTSANGNQIKMKWVYLGYKGYNLYELEMYSRWTGSLSEGGSEAYVFGVDEDYVGRLHTYERKNEIWIRPVCDY
jgi:hypothetical protein